MAVISRVGRIADRVVNVARRAVVSLRSALFLTRTFLRSAIRLQLPAQVALPVMLGGLAMAIASCSTKVRGGIFKDENQESVVVRVEEGVSKGDLAVHLLRFCGRTDTFKLIDIAERFIDDVSLERGGNVYIVRNGIGGVGDPAAGPDPRQAENLAELQRQLTEAKTKIQGLEGRPESCPDPVISVDRLLTLVSPVPISIPASTETSVSISAPEGHLFADPWAVQVLFSGQRAQDDWIKFYGATLSPDRKILTGRVRTSRNANPTPRAGQEPALRSFTLAALLAPVTGESAESFIGSLPIEVTASPAPALPRPPVDDNLPPPPPPVDAGTDVRRPTRDPLP